MKNRTIIAFMFLFLYLMMLNLTVCDTIITNKKKLKNNIVIVKESFKSVSFYFKVDESRTLQYISRQREQIFKVKHDSLPTNFLIANNYFVAGSYRHAIDAYSRASRAGDWTLQHCLFKIGQCYQKLGNLANAVRSYRRLLKRIPDTYYKADAYYNIARCYMQAGKISSAYKFFYKAAQNYNQIYMKKQAEQSYYQVGRALYAGKRYSQALKFLQRIQENLQNLNLKNDIILYIARCYIGLNDYTKASKLCLEIIASAPIEKKKLMAGAYSCLGEVYLQRGETKKSLLCFLRVVMMYGGQDKLTKKAYKKAAYCFRLLEKKNPAYRSRAMQLKRMQEKKFNS